MAIDNIENVPDSPGVYIFKDKKGNIIYIGKGLNLKKRVSSYINPTSFKTSILAKYIDNVEFLLCDSGLEALILEANLIKKYRPKFNVSLKDDKSYPFIRITKDEFPRISITRKREKGSYYFGPYASSKSLKTTINITKSLFGIRTCKKMPKQKNPCLSYHLKQCLAPCQGNISKEKYGKNVKSAASFLSGRYKVLLRSMERRMKNLAKKLLFEEAGRIRDNITAIKNLFETQKAYFIKSVNYDVIGQFGLDNKKFVAVLSIREGRLISQNTFDISKKEDGISGFIKQFYIWTESIPDEIIIEEDIEDKGLIEEWLTTKRKKKVSVTIPKRGKKKGLLVLSKKNAGLALKKDKGEESSIFDVLGFIPKTIEAIDISNIQGKYASGAVVVFEDGKPRRDLYRRFRIKIESHDDIGMIKEVIERRYKKMLKEKQTIPNLIVIDGGRGHLNTAINTLKSIGIAPNVISIAKFPDRIFLPERKIPIPVSSNLSVIQQIRDEAHRFSLSYHKTLRSVSLWI
ncbi:TPA: excinuclease ABC subunit C [bacterium]|nr:excinuclease ABC subunit C [bacterium]